LNIEKPNSNGGYRYSEIDYVKVRVRLNDRVEFPAPLRLLLISLSLFNVGKGVHLKSGPPLVLNVSFLELVNKQVHVISKGQHVDTLECQSNVVK
jgi:hypothetical protein